MEILRFTLSGKNAFFKKPEVNSYCYYTYGNIHKVALLGIFGAILGYGGYTQMQGYVKGKKSAKLSESYPEFYEKLKGISVSVIPLSEKGYIPKKVQVFNNSVGYASKEQGGNLITKEQWLENPKWEICLLIDCDRAKDIKEAICNGQCTFIPYLGKNDHFADISKVSIENAVELTTKSGELDCLVPKRKVDFVELDYDEQEELGCFSTFKYEEALPLGLDGFVNHYIMETFVYTDSFLEIKEGCGYQLKTGEKIVFY